ncbi:hypothetical protein [Mucilaginibacter lacusdianchii]|uniref:hypothetical protein n=1 Tax=Mucilaginibacter lacusdianchii TaxID=2684211 RepID=UPI00131D477D|nr:hypothetical protein [Mucilaginibacter sp. JXJ CY 39]
MENYRKRPDYLRIPSAAVIVLKGKPITITTTTTHYGVNEHCYFENGKLTVVQN